LDQPHHLHALLPVRGQGKREHMTLVCAFAGSLMNTVAEHMTHAADRRPLDRSRREEVRQSMSESYCAMIVD
jgi:hypothetical protein